jgi:hypothetical protein
MVIQLPLAAHDAALAGIMIAMGDAARRASAEIAKAPPEKRTAALKAMATRIRAASARILEANQLDMAAAQATRCDACRDGFPSWPCQCAVPARRARRAGGEVRVPYISFVCFLV